MTRENLAISASAILALDSAVTRASDCLTRVARRKHIPDILQPAHCRPKGVKVGFRAPIALAIIIGSGICETAFAFADMKRT